MMVLEEATMAVDRRLFPLEYLLNIIALKPKSIELAVTVRYADAMLIEKIK